VYFTYNNSRIYIKIPKDNIDLALVDIITLELVAEVPSKVMMFNGISEGIVKYQEYPITDVDWSIIKNNILVYNLGIRPDEK
jgi:hypothetical protein